jgi:glucose-6-phosphate 1-epimerase
MELTELNKKYGIPGTLSFSSGEGGLPIATIRNNYASAVVSLYGAQVLSYKPHGQEDLLWMSSKSVFKEGKAIRGGIPLCFPWFGKHATDPLLPQHGFARLSEWEVAETVVLANGAIEIRLQLHQSSATKALWPFDFSATVVVIVGTKLELKLKIINTDDRDFTYSDALHTYLQVSDISNISIEGLYQTPYYDGFGDIPTKQQEALLNIPKEENRRYVEHIADCIVQDKDYNRKIRVSKTGSKVTVVWNPWIETTKTMGDMTPDGYKTFICVEAANSYDDVITLGPNQDFTISTTIGLEDTPEK